MIPHTYILYADVTYNGHAQQFNKYPCQDLRMTKANTKLVEN